MFFLSLILGVKHFFKEHWFLWRWKTKTKGLDKLLSTKVLLLSGHLVDRAENRWWIELNLEKAMAPHSSTLAWEIPWMEEPGGLQSLGSLRVGHD